MKLTFLGGADEVGASCTLLELGGRRVLVDCGIRMNPEDGDPLPYLSPIQEAGGLDAIVLTHAHLDHVGAMPMLVTVYPDVPIYMTPATLKLASVMLVDALKVMAIQSQQLGQAPLYGESAVEQLMTQVRCVPFGQTQEICEGDVRMQFNPAGHILGAATALLESDEGSIMMTGDISVTDQLTIPGMMVPGCKPDAVVIESTYGGRLHANRTAEERRLIRQVGTTLDAGGSVLFPAFAVGRAQEVILILSRAMERGDIKRVPIFVDGLVKQICTVYTSQRHLLTNWLRKRVDTYGNPFFYDDGPAIPVWDPRKRGTLLKEAGQAVIVSSSGMLTGGPSQLYARQLAPDPKNLIAITGYQDEESPGRAIQNLAQEGHGMLRIGEGEQVYLACEVATYSLSAHADTAQMVGVLSAFTPNHTMLVHGDGGARAAMQAAIERAGIGQVHLPTIGETIEVRGHPRDFLKKRTRRPAAGGAEAPTRPPLSEEHLVTLAQELLDRDGQGGAYTVQELIWAWGDLEGAGDEQRIADVVALLSAPNIPFKRDRKRPYIYRVRSSFGHVVTHQGSGKKRSKAQKAAIKRKETELINRLLQEFPAETGLGSRKVRAHIKTIILGFDFPDIARERYGAKLDALGKEFGWTLRVRDTPRQDALVEAVGQVLPEGWEAVGNPALHIARGAVGVKVKADRPVTDAERSAVEDAYHALTRYRLELTVASDGASAKPPAAKPDSAGLVAPDQRGAVLVRRAQMEINTAFDIIHTAFDAEPHRPMKLSKKGDVIELAFITEVIGERYNALLSELSREVGWKVRVKPYANQHEVKRLAQALLPDNAPVLKGPAFHGNEREVRFRLSRPLGRGVAEAARHRFYEETGYALVFIVQP